MASESYIQTAYLRGQLLAAHEAIADIWKDPSTIGAATALLPPDLRTADMPPAKPDEELLV